MAASRPAAGKYSGRSVEVTSFRPVAAALGRLNRTLNQNNVKKELRLEERFEKPNAKRRRLKSERHRRRFAEMVTGIFAMRRLYESAPVVTLTYVLAVSLMGSFAFSNPMSDFILPSFFPFFVNALRTLFDVQ